MRFVAVAVLVVMAAASAAPVHAQDDGDQVRLGADLVEVRAVVTDRTGRLVGGLGKADFEVLDAGASQEIAFFSEQRVAGASAAPTVEGGQPAVATGQPTEPAVRTVVLFVDDFHISALSLARVRKALKRFVAEELSDRDLLGLVSASGRIRMFGQFGADRSAVMAAIDAIPITPPSGWSDDFPPLLAARVKLNDEFAIAHARKVIRRRDRDEYSSDSSIDARARDLANELLQEDAAFRTATLDTLKKLCDQLGGLPGQRLILMYTDGFTLRDRDGVPNANDLRAVISHATRAGVVVSAILASGLTVNSGMSAESRVTPDASGYVFQLARAAALDAESGPGAIVKQTGGTLYRDRNDLEALGHDVLAQNATYYAIAYYMPEARDTDYREVEVRIRNHPGLLVRAQRGYVAGEKRAPAAAPAPTDARARVIESLVRPALSTDLSVSLELDGLEPAKGKALVRLRAQVAGAGLDLRDAGGGRFPYSLDVTAVVYDLAGKPAFVGSQNLSGVLTGADAEFAVQSSLRYGVPIDPLGPGVYQVCVAFHDRTTGRIGARTLWLVVPKQKKR